MQDDGVAPTIATRQLPRSGFVLSTIAQNGTIIDYRLHINVLNSGRTVAKNYVSHVNFAVFDAIPENLRFPDRPHDKLNKNIIGPQSRTYFQVDLFIQDAIATYEGRKKPLIYGWIEYDDIFPQNARHRCEFCMAIEVFADPRFAPRVEQGKAIPIVTISPYGGYNAYDDDCLYRPGKTPIAEEGELPPLTLPPDMPGVTYRP